MTNDHSGKGGVPTFNSKSRSLSQGIIRVFAHLSRRRRWQFVGLFLFMIIGVAAELATLGAVLPFLALLAEPGTASNYPLLQRLFSLFGWRNENSILLPATILFAIVALCAAAIRMLLSWISLKCTMGAGVDISVEIYRRALYQPYKFHVAHNSSEIISGLDKSRTVVFEIINPLVQSALSICLSVAILAGLILIDPLVASAACLGFAVIYLVVTLATRRRLSTYSKLIAKNETLRLQAAQEGLGGIRDILIDGSQQVYVDRYWAIDASLKHAQAVANFIGTAPRYLIESVGMVLIVALAYWLSFRAGGVASALPVLGALAIGAQKLMPQMQQIYYGWAKLSVNGAILWDVITLLDYPIPQEYGTPSVGRMRLEHGIRLNDLRFRYNENSIDVIRRLNLEIKRGSRVGFVGATGSGKSTLIDLIMGLLEPTSGSIEVDHEVLTCANRRKWQASIAHVPQSVYLADSSIAQNIALGMNFPHIDEPRLREAARKAQLAEFIENLPEKYATKVGERGVQLSGGQRQRIGLARALYRQPHVLVLDEATSALDDATERAVMEAIDSLGDSVTVLMVAHRISTLRNCDCIFELSQGSLARKGTYHELFETRTTA